VVSITVFRVNHGVHMFENCVYLKLFQSSIPVQCSSPVVHSSDYTLPVMIE